MKNQLFILFFASSFQLTAQETALSAGGEAIGSGGTVSYSIGQVSNQHLESASGNVNEGVQQPYELFVLEVADIKLEIDLSVFPNPTSDYLMLQISELLPNLYFYLYDQNGKILMSQPISEVKSKIRMAQYSNGGYQLHITQGTESLKKVQIIKQF